MSLRRIAMKQTFVIDVRVKFIDIHGSEYLYTVKNVMSYPRPQPGIRDVND